MKSLLSLGFAASVACATFTPALAGADGGTPLRQASAADCRVEAIPAYVRCVERIVVDPPVVCEQRVPRYETVTVDVFETRQVPVYQTVQRPVYATREVPIYREECVPVWGEKEVPVYSEVSKPVTLKLWRPFACEDACIKLWDKCEKVCEGTKTVPAIVGQETRQVQCGTRVERYQTGTTSEESLCGHRCERVRVGERQERRLAGYDTQQVVTRPARERVVTNRESVPCERVTVVSDGNSRESPLPGTARVLSESQYRSALQAAR